jgi:hypothetical protein
MMADGGGPQAGIDSDEQDAGARAQAVQKWSGPDGYVGHGVLLNGG